MAKVVMRMRLNATFKHTFPTALLLLLQGFESLSLFHGNYRPSNSHSGRSRLSFVSWYSFLKLSFCRYAKATNSVCSDFVLSRKQTITLIWIWYYFLLYVKWCSNHLHIWTYYLYCLCLFSRCPVYFRLLCVFVCCAVSVTGLGYYYVAHVFSKLLWNSPSRPYYYWYHLCFYIPHALYFYCKIFLF
jgi:hypothetical protein